MRARTCARLTHAVVTQAAVGGPRRPEHPAGAAVLELDRLLVDQHLQGSRGRPAAGVCRGVCPGRERQALPAGRAPPPLTPLLLQLHGLVRRGSRQDARVAEAGAQQGEQHKQEEDPPDGGYAAGQVLHQEGTAWTCKGCMSTNN